MTQLSKYLLTLAELIWNWIASPMIVKYVIIAYKFFDNIQWWLYSNGSSEELPV